ncbi:hypothetical protein MLD38_039967 [Melastoma candidum]|uniref:Uncharacterized protein n=1 Tax=Melastoma candidum TaxID=119954 RepID=A0ACB9L510_9MYRT|nr:hypothetical protein MLD38_039967 [Melastoma candidum]
MLIYQYLMATCVILSRLFASDDWKHLNFQTGEVSLRDDTDVVHKNMGPVLSRSSQADLRGLRPFLELDLHGRAARQPRSRSRVLPQLSSSPSTPSSSGPLLVVYGRARVPGRNNEEEISVLPRRYITSYIHSRSHQSTHPPIFLLLTSLCSLGHISFTAMGEASKGLQIKFAADQEVEARESNPLSYTGNSAAANDPRTKSYQWWIRVSIYSAFVLAGQSVGTLLGRVYYDKGGKSMWLATLVQLVGFVLLLPLYWPAVIKLRKERDTVSLPQPQQPSCKMLVFVYVSLGVLVAANCFLYSVGLLDLPVSTYSLICASQLAFNALFSFFLNSQKFTPFIVNSLILLTISSTLLVFQPSPSSNSTSSSALKAKYAVGFVCTVAASAGYGLALSLTELAFRKVIKQGTFKAILDMLIYPSIVSTAIIIIGLFASGDWKHLSREMENYQPGKLSYVMTLTWIAISWGVFSVGAIGLIFDVSSLFSNSISAAGLPIVPVFAAIFFHDRMDGIKVISMVLAIWGFASYVYQQYLDDAISKKKMKSIDSGIELSISA